MVTTVSFSIFMGMRRLESRLARMRKLLAANEIADQAAHSLFFKVPLLDIKKVGRRTLKCVCSLQNPEVIDPRKPFEFLKEPIG